MRVGRNDPCPCGSGKKSKRCCGDAEVLHLPPPEVVRHMFKRLRASPFEGPAPVTAMFQGHRFRAVGSKIYINPPSETFHEFIIDSLKRTFGRAWLKEQEASASSERHAVWKWLMACAEQTKDAKPDFEGQQFRATPSGETQELLALAFDLYKLQQVVALPGRIIKRLRHAAEFQGARYEVAVAATFIRCGFKIEWNTDKSHRGPEFTAKHDASGESIGVEAKSRRRAGTLNERGTRPDASTIRADVRSLVLNALGQHPGDKPFAIFVDANVPPQVPGFQERLWEDAKELVREFTAIENAPDPFSLLALTNCGWHYAGSQAAMTRSACHVVVGRNPQFPIRSERALIAVVNSIGMNGVVPDED